MVLLKIYIIHELNNNREVDINLIDIIRKEDEDAYRIGELCASIQNDER